MTPEHEPKYEAELVYDARMRTLVTRVLARANENGLIDDHTLMDLDNIARLEIESLKRT